MGELETLIGMLEISGTVMEINEKVSSPFDISLTGGKINLEVSGGYSGKISTTGADISLIVNDPFWGEIDTTGGKIKIVLRSGSQGISVHKPNYLPGDITVNGLPNPDLLYIDVLKPDFNHSKASWRRVYEPPSMREWYIKPAIIVNGETVLLKKEGHEYYGGIDRYGNRSFSYHLKDYPGKRSPTVPILYIQPGHGGLELSYELTPKELDIARNMRRSLWNSLFVKD